MLWTDFVAAPRRVAPELLDALAPEDPRAQRSRRDLQRIHRAMGSVRILNRTVRSLMGSAQAQTILELGAGDGSLLLRLARALRPSWTGVHLTLLDRHDVVSDQTRAAFRDLGWKVSTLCMDIGEWTRSPATENYELCITTLFLHHFSAVELEALLMQVATRANRFIACEPRRNALSRLGCRLVGCLGANKVTREDAVTSVEAGFSGRELEAKWPSADNHWMIEEYPVWPFTHCFVAKRVRTYR